MSTQFTNRQWRLPNEENKSKSSNYSMDFSGSQYIDTNQTLDSSYSALTLSAWVNYTLISDYSGTIFGQWIQNNNSGSTIICYTVSNKIQVYLGPSATSLTSTTTLTTGTWYNVILRFDGSTMKLYINGTEEDSISFTSINNSAQNLILGAYSNSTQTGYQAFLNGKLDAVAIFNYALSSSQVTTLYGSSSTGIGNPMSLSPKPVAYYPLGDQDAFNGSNYLVPNSSLKDYVFDFIPNDYIDCGTGLGDTLGTYTGDLTFSIWFNADTVNPANDGIFYIGDFNSQGALQVNIYNNNIIFRANGGGGSKQFSFTDTTSWHNLTCVYLAGDRANSKLYLDGVLQTTSDGGSFPSSLSLTGLKTIIGSYYNSTFNFDGKLSNFQIFNTALPATGSNSVETLYNNGSPLTSMSGFTSLQGWWKLDASATYDGSNWTIPDDSSNSNDGTSSGMTQANLVQSDLSFTSGYSPYALDFDSASSDAITLGNTIGNGFTQITCSIWANISTSGLTQSSYRNFLVKFPSGSGSATPFELRSNNGNRTDSYNNKLFFRINTNTGAYGFTDTGFEFTEANKWHHLVGTYDGSNVKLFVDGVEYYSISANGTLNSNNDNALIGYHPYGNFNGKLSNASIWNTALTSAQVTEIYSEGIPQNLLNHSAASSLVSWWQLGSNSSFNSSLNQWTCIDEKGTNTGESSQTFNEDAIVDGVGSYANGLSSGMGGDEVIGDAPYSTANSLSVNMDVLDRVEDTPA